MEKVEVNIVIQKDNPNIQISFIKDNQVVLWDDLTIPERARIVNAFAYGYACFGEDNGQPSIQLR